MITAYARVNAASALWKGSPFVFCNEDTQLNYTVLSIDAHNNDDHKKIDWIQQKFTYMPMISKMF